MICIRIIIAVIRIRKTLLLLLSFLRIISMLTIFTIKAGCARTSNPVISSPASGTISRTVVIVSSLRAFLCARKAANLRGVTGGSRHIVFSESAFRRIRCDAVCVCTGRCVITSCPMLICRLPLWFESWNGTIFRNALRSSVLESLRIKWHYHDSVR